MIKAKGTTADGRDVLVLGLSYANLRRLQADEPIRFNAKPYGLDIDVVIFAGATEMSMAKLITRLSGVEPQSDPDPNAP